MGLYDKYTVIKNDYYIPVNYPVFVLRIDGKDRAAIKALETYARETDDKELQKALFNHVYGIAVERSKSESG